MSVNYTNLQTGSHQIARINLCVLAEPKIKTNKTIYITTITSNEQLCALVMFWTTDKGQNSHKTERKALKKIVHTLQALKVQDLFYYFVARKKTWILLSAF